MMAPRSIRLTGSELALIRSAVFMAIRWPSQCPRALSSADEDVEDQLHSKHDAFLKAAGLPDTWQRPEHVKARQAASGTIELDAASIVRIAKALRWCDAEFRDPRAWIDFCIASAGDIAAYDDLTPSSLSELANRLSAPSDEA
jgi:hypothetical protein